MLKTNEKQIVIEPYKITLEIGDKIIYDNQTVQYITNKNDLAFQGNVSITNEDSFYDSFKKIIGQENTLFKNDLINLKNKTKGCPIIIGGCGRSGTTLLSSVLGASKEVNCIDFETYAFYPKPYRLSLITNRIDNRIWCEKTPKNVLVFNEIFNLFDGNVKLIHIVRDGRDVITSKHPTDLSRYWVPLKRWIDDVSKGLEFKDKTLLIKYEDLVNNFNETMKKVCAYCDIEFNENIVNFHKNTNVTDSYAWLGKVKPIYTNRVGKWKNHEHKEIIDKFYSNDRAVELLKYFGYK
jgi:hypothetical protein